MTDDAQLPRLVPLEECGELALGQYACVVGGEKLVAILCGDEEWFAVDGKWLPDPTHILCVGETAAVFPEEE